MEQRRAFKLIIACGIAMTLQGCVVAAIPIAAGGLMAGGGRIVPRTETASEAELAAAQASANEAVEVGNVSAPIGTVEVNSGSASDRAVILVQDDETNEAAGLAQTETVSGAFAEFDENLAPGRNAALAEVETEEQAATITAIPPTPASNRMVSLAEEVATPTAAAPAQTSFVANPPASVASVSSATSSASSSNIVIPIPSAPPAVAGGTFFDPLYVYAAAPEFAVSGAREAATLLDPTSLEPDRTECTQGDSTVLIDLDPEEGDLFPVNTRSASPALAEKLADLRVRGVTIAWISQNSVEKANDIRVALFQSGLDPLGTDELLLMRTSDERKQTRRDDLARNSCLIAIAGDTRSDFHELFDYLLNPSDAVALEPLIGEGWFLIPTPLLAERTLP